MIEELKPREQKAYVRGKMQEVSTENNTTIVLSSDTEMEEEEEPVKDRKRRNTKSEEKVEEEDGKAGEKTFGTPISLSRKSSSGSGSVSKTEPGKTMFPEASVSDPDLSMRI